jgi:hypothetical protein
MKRILIALGIALLLLTSCSSSPKKLTEDIVGTWKNTSGYTIQFKSGGAGFIPGVAGKIPDSSFIYTVMDESHIQMNLQGQLVTIGITINGDQLTWKDDLGEVSYTRVK